MLREPLDLDLHPSLGPQQRARIQQLKVCAVNGLEVKLAQDLNDDDLELDHRHDLADAHPRPLHEGREGIRIGRGGALQPVPAVRVELVTVGAPDGGVVLHDGRVHDDGGALGDGDALYDDVLESFARGRDGYDKACKVSAQKHIVGSDEQSFSNPRR